MGVLGGLILKPVGGIRAAVFNTLEHLNCSENAAFKVQYFEVEIQFIPNDIGTFMELISQMGADNKGWQFFIRDTDALSFSGQIGGSFTGVSTIGTVNYGVINTASVIFSQDTTNVKIVLNENIENLTLSSSDSIVYGTHPLIVASRADEVIPFDGSILSTKYWELNSSLTTRIAELVNLDITNGDANSIPNIGADKPASSDGIWVPAGSGTYVDL